MKGSTSQPKVFISYSWTTPQHEQWVLEFATRLTNDGIVVILDKWQLREGQDKHVFMEQMVKDKNINKVLVVCDSGYREKADNRKGGVGTETQLISKEVYENVEQEKFVPIIKEFDSEKKPCVPYFMASRIHIDLSSDQIYEENYMKLVRNIYGKPSQKKPPLGVAPAYITEEEQIVLKTSHKVAQIKNAITSNSAVIPGLIHDYMDSFISSLKDFSLSTSIGAEFDEDVIKSIECMLPLRDDFVEFIRAIFKSHAQVDLDHLHSFFEKLIPFRFKPLGITRWREIDFDNYKFFIYELFLYFIAILIKLRRFQDAAYFIRSQYFFHDENSGELKHQGIRIFNSYIASLDETRNIRLNLQRLSVTADLIKRRAMRQDVIFSDLLEVDLLIFYITDLEGGHYNWFPRCSVYNSYSGKLEIFERMVSVQQFNHTKVLFGVNDIQEFKRKITTYAQRIQQENRIRFSGLYDYHIEPLEQIINLDMIGTIN